MIALKILQKTFHRSPQFYSISMLAWFACWLVVGDANWILVLVNRHIVYLFGVIPFLGILFLLLQRVKNIIWLIYPALIFITLYYPYFLPKNTSRSSNYNLVRVMTYNVLFTNSDDEAIAGVILNHLPDVLALQEVQPEMMSALEKRLGDEYPYSLMGTENDYGTTAVFSRHPVIESSVLDLQADRPDVVVKIEIEGREITFVSVHLMAYGLQWAKLRDIPAVTMERTFNQNRQAELVLERIKQEDGILIVGCDCNSYETSSSYRIFDGWLDNSAREVGWVVGGENLPGAKRDTYLQHIDYVWYRGELEPTNVFRVSDSGGSDHLPVLAVFSMN